ncbi:MAG: PIN domain protein [Gemmatimonadaceae bacterium]
MRTPRVYPDTSVLGGCFDREFAVWSLALMEDFRAGRFIAVLSDLLAAELERAPGPVRALYEELRILAPVPQPVTSEAGELADRYAAHEIVPPRFRNDMLHIALATVADADVLVSWNFRHVVRFDKIRAFNAVNLEAGYRPFGHPFSARGSHLWKGIRVSGRPLRQRPSSHWN